MLIRRFLAGLVLGAAALLSGCGDGDPGPFEGDWVSATAGRLMFEGKNWSDGDGDSGDFSYAGAYPVFSVRFSSGAGQFDKIATFADERTFELCDLGAPAVCDEFVWDKPTLH